VVYDELLSVWSRYIGHVVTNVGGVFEDIKSPIKMECLYGCSKHSNKKPCSGYKLTLLHHPTWLVNLKTLKNTDYSVIRNVLESCR
jgi:hypothetical protein